MTKDIYKIFIIFIFITVISSGHVYADKVTERLDEFIYSLNIFHNNGSLTVDKTAAWNYDIIADSFSPYSKPGGKFLGRILSQKGEVLADFSFDVPETSKPRGKLTVKAPFFANAGRVIFLNSAGKELLSVSVAESSFCNDDNVCNAEVGEDWRNCRNDCIQSAGTLPTASSTPVSVPEEEEFSFVPFVFLAVFLLIMIVVGYIVFGLRHQLPPPPQ